jgi:hypothetical protein
MDFEERDLSADVEAVRAEHAPDAIVLSAGSDFETLDPGTAEDLGLLVDSLDPISYPADWIPADAPEPLHRFASDAFTIGLQGDGSVCWTRQTDPPVVIVKPRVQGSPQSFVDFLIAEALVEVGLDVPEAFPGFFEAHYRDLADAVPLGPNATYQLALALYDGWVGLHAREVFRDWRDRPLAEAWTDAGQRLAPRLDDLSSEIARGQTDFPAATELACAAIKHDLDLPAPFSALATTAYREQGAPFAVRWAEKTFEKLP